VASEAAAKLAASLANLVRTLVDSSEVERAREVLDEAMPLAAGFARAERPEVARLLLEQARLEVSRGRGDTAADNARLALAANVRGVGPFNLEIARCLTVLGLSLLDARDRRRRSAGAALAFDPAAGRAASVGGRVLQALRVAERRLGHMVRARQLLGRAAAPRSRWVLGMLRQRESHQPGQPAREDYQRPGVHWNRRPGPGARLARAVLTPPACSRTRLVLSLAGDRRLP
jgi:hypothetical protein